jgi:hypothetical protein
VAKSRLKTLNIKRYLGGNPIQSKMWRSHQRRFAFSNSISLLLLVELYMFLLSPCLSYLSFYAYIEDNIRFKCGGRVYVFLKKKKNRKSKKDKNMKFGCVIES